MMIATHIERVDHKEGRAAQMTTASQIVMSALQNTLLLIDLRGCQALPEFTFTLENPGHVEKLETLVSRLVRHARTLSRILKTIL